MPNPVGRPPKYKTPEELQAKIDAYFKGCFREVPVRNTTNGELLLDSEGNVVLEVRQIRPITVTGLAIACDMDRNRLLEYSEKEEFYHTIKRAKEICHNYAEEQLYLMKNATGAIFSLKNNWSWVDKSQQDLNVSGGLGLTQKIEEGLARVEEAQKNSGK